MLVAGKAVKVSIYLSEGSTYHGVPTYSSIIDFLFYRGVSGATVLKGVAGFGAGHHMHSASFVEISDHLPLKIEFIESREKVDEILGKLEEMAGSGMIEIQETTVAKASHVSRKKPIPPAHLKIEGKAKLMRIYIGDSDRWKDKPLHLSHDCSIMLSVIDTEEKIQSFLPLVDQMVEEGLVVLSDVDIIKYSYRALEVEEHPTLEGSEGTSV